MSGLKGKTYEEIHGIDGALLLKEKRRQLCFKKPPGFKKNNVPWNKGLTKETDKRVAEYGANKPKHIKSGKKGNQYAKREIRYCLCGCNKTKLVSVNSKWHYFLGHANIGRVSSIKGMTYEGFYGKRKSKEIKAKKLVSLSKILSSGNYHQTSKQYKTGHFYSQKNNKVLFYRSSWELIAFKILEQMYNVVHYEYEAICIPYEYKGTLCGYFPDICITYQDGSKEIIEIKPKYLLTEERNKLKFEAVRKYCIENNINFNIWSDDKIKNNQHI